MRNVKKAFWLIYLLKRSRNVWGVSWKYTFDLRPRWKPVYGEADDSAASVLLNTGTFKVPTAAWKSSKSHRLWQFDSNCLSGKILLKVTLQRRKMNSREMTQSEVCKCLLQTLLHILLLLNPWVSAGFISPGNSVSVGSSPTLRYLLACGHLPARPPIFSTHDIYTNEQVLGAVFVFVLA